MSDCLIGINLFYAPVPYSQVGGVNDKMFTPCVINDKICSKDRSDKDQTLPDNGKAMTRQKQALASYQTIARFLQRPRNPLLCLEPANKAETSLPGEL